MFEGIRERHRKNKCARALKRLLRRRNLALDALLPTLYHEGFTEAEIRFALVELKKGKIS